MPCPTFSPRSRLPGLLLGLLLLGLAPAALQARGLPPPLRAWMDNEQGRLTRSVDTSRLMALTNHQDPRYAPEARRTFRVKSYWVDAGRLHAFEGEGLAPELRSLLRRTSGGRQQVRLLVHPESEGLYRELLRSAEPAPSLMATATASSRTLLVWPPGSPERAFFAKLSLDKEIGGVRRTVSQGEVARSVGINNVLHLAARRGELPAGFKFIPEVFSAIPRGMEEGGMVIRQIPREVLDGSRRYVPFFSLIAEPPGARPLLAEMISRSGLSAEDFIRERLIRPFARQWVELAAQRGIAPEPHAQNLLLELGDDGQPTGSFVHRDFGGFNVDFEYRRRARMALPRGSGLPRITTIEHDYKNDRHDARAQMRKLDSFFYGGIVYNLDHQVPAWASRGWVRGGPGLREGVFKDMLVKSLEEEYAAVTGRRLSLDGDLANLSRLLAARKPESRLLRGLRALGDALLGRR